MGGLYFPPGVYRLAAPIPMKKGDAAMGVLCHACGTELPMLQAPENPVTAYGEGQFSIPCRFCLDEGMYEPRELVPMVVQEETTRPERLEPSGRYRGKLAEDYPGVRPTFGANLIEQRPIAAKVMARCVTLSAEVEAECAGMLAQFLGSDSVAAANMFLAIRNARAQFEGMVAAAQVSLEDRDLRLFNAYMHLKEGLDRERNFLAHGRFGFATQVTRGVLWMSLEDHSRITHDNRTKSDPGAAMRAIIEQTYVYEPEDLETIAQETEDLVNEMGQFKAYLTWPKGERRDQRYRELCEVPHVAKALAHLDDRENNRARTREQKRAKRKGK